MTKNKILRLPAVKEKIGASRSFIYQAMQNGTFPKTIPLGARAVGWLESAVDGWIVSRINGASKDKN